jgi:hypothetical protein
MHELHKPWFSDSLIWMFLGSRTSSYLQRPGEGGVIWRPKQLPLQQSVEYQHCWPFERQLASIEDWTAQGKRKSSQAAAWKRVRPVFVSTDATCSRFTSTPPTPSSSSRAASVICTATSIMQAMASRWTAALETLEVDIVMIAKPFSLNTHSNQNACERNTGSMERRADSSAEQIVRDCEETVRICAFLLTHGSTPARDSYWKGPRCTATWLTANEIGLDLYPDGKGKSSSDILWSLDQRISWEDIQLAKGLKCSQYQKYCCDFFPWSGLSLIIL